MPINTVKLLPGVNTDLTPVLNEAGYSSSQLGRFKAGLFQKLGGWSSQAIYNNNIPGIPKDIHAWQDLNADKYLLIGADTGLFVINNNVLRDRTPQTKVTEGATLSTTSGSPLVRIDDAGVTEITTDDVVFFDTPISVGGLVVSGYYRVNQFLASGAYNINVGKNATATTTTFATPEFSTTAQSSSVEVTLNDHGLSVGDEVNFPIPTTGRQTDVTISNASPGVVTWNSHGLVANDAIEFATTGTLPSPLIAGTTYYVKTVLNANTFTLSATAGGAAINTTTAGSGVHTAYVNGGDGVVINGTYTVTAATTNTFDIIISAQAVVTSDFFMNQGNTQLVYYLVIGPQAVGSGYGTGSYSTGGYGTGSVPAAQTGAKISAANWELDNFGQLGLACPRNGGIYYYDPNSGFNTSQLVPNAPLFNGGMFTAMPQQQIVAWGSSTDIQIGHVQDPLLIRWCDVGNFTDWTAAQTNQAGSYRLSNGSRIVGARQGPQNGIIWTDLDVWAMSYLGGRLVYGFNKIGTNCGLLAQHAHTTQLGNIYWMSQSNFFMLAGQGVMPIPCTVWDSVFQNIDTDNYDKCIAASNTPFNEVWFFYPSTNSIDGENDSYAKFNTLDKTWDNGLLGRTAWTDQSVYGFPIATTKSGAIVQHEVTNDADGSPMASSMRTGYWMLAEGEVLAFVDWLLPDFKWGTYAGSETAEIQLTIYVTDYPGDNPVAYGPFTVNKLSQFVNLRVRGRYMAIEVTSNQIGSFMRLGGIKYRYSLDGRR